MNNQIYKTDLQDFLFLLWSQFALDDDLFADGKYNRCSEQAINEILQRAKEFACEKLGVAYQASDEEGCELEEGNVVLPSSYRALWHEFQNEWGNLSVPEEFGGFDIPPVVMQMVLEMFMGANPSFMTYGGFCRPSATLVEKYGSDIQKRLFKSRLEESQWTSCLCLTEPQAGSDVSLVNTKAVKQDDGTYLLTGEKYLISAGMHDLTENTIYFVLARGENSALGTYGLSCFIVPKYWVEENGEIAEFNHVECIDLADKMGFKGCANTHLTFGQKGQCRAYLLGDRENVGLIQFLTLMNQARISTGVYALGMASSAYHNALRYALNRSQGKKFEQSFNPRASTVKIVEHIDVQRMLLEMKSKVEGCRALIAKLSICESYVSKYQDQADMQALLAENQGLVDLLTPVVKAYVSDQAWRICELAIQTCGGKGYLKELGLEQYARDIKVLSIWEGTNYVQSQDLIRDKLGLGNESKLYRIFCKQINAFLEKASDYPDFNKEFESLKLALEDLDKMLVLVREWIRSKKMEKIPAYSTRILHAFGEVTLSWLLLLGACAARDELSKSPDEKFESYCEAKIASAKFFVFNILPNVHSTLSIMNEDESYIKLPHQVWQSVTGEVE